MRWLLVSLLALWCGASTTWAHEDNFAKEPHVRIFFPRLELDSEHNERIIAFSVTIKCGYVVGFSPIPAEWSISLTPPDVRVETISAEAGHGASFLWNLTTLDGAIAVSKYDASCFDVSAVVITDRPERNDTIEHKFSMRQLTLRK